MPFNQYIKELSLIHKTMDTTAKRRYSLGNKSSFFKNCRGTSVKGRRNSIKPRKACYTFNSSVSEIGFSDIKMIKPCFVKLDKICDVELSKLLAKNIYGSKVGSNGKSQETPSLRSIEMIHNPTKNLEHKRNIDLNVNIDPKVLATEDHLDLLMAREMKSSNNTQMDKMIPRRVQCETTKSIKHFNLNPVVLLKKLSPQFISKAISGKLEMDSHEFTRRRKRKVLPLQRMAATNEVRRSKRSSNIKLGCGCCSKSSSKGLRRSERLSNISLSTENQNGYFHNRRNSCPSGRQYKVEGGKERLFGNKENIPRPRKRSNGKINNSDDEEEFYGFENNSKNRHRIKKMKEALKILNAQPSGKEKHRIFKLKESLKTSCPLSSGKENGRTAIVNRDVKCLMRDKVPFKAINRVEGKCSNNEDMSKKPTLEDYQSSICSNLLNARDKMMLHRNNVQYKDAGAEVMALNRLEILKLFKKKEAKLNICKMVRDQGKVIVSKTGELLNEDHLKEPLNFYSDKYYIKKTGRRKPLWAEESITNIIIEYQEEIPADIIAGYFGGNNGTDLTSIAAFLGLEFPEDDIKTR